MISSGKLYETNFNEDEEDETVDRMKDSIS